MTDTLRERTARCKAGAVCGISSYCTANELVIEACLEQAAREGGDVLLEATANQVNQFGGYTGMRPADYRDFVYRVADGLAFPRSRVILGGDHLGPLTWAEEPEAEAMEKAEELVRLYVLAGYQKIHLDTSMRLGDDDPGAPLSDETIARRGARLYRACAEAFEELRRARPGAKPPVYIIGSEVPIPGGAQEAEETVSVTRPEALEATVETYRRVFGEEGLSQAFQNIIGVVVQPGVEFGDGAVFRYDREKAAALTACARRLPGIVLEGHSTDYQPPQALREMVEDGVAILKVGPALTFALREGLFDLSAMERELVPREEQARFPDVLEAAMRRDPSNWLKHYHGTEFELALRRKYSFSDRCRYYLTVPEVRKAVERLFRNLDRVELPRGMISQFMPRQYQRVRDGKLPPRARELAKDCVARAVEEYRQAAGE